MAETLYSRHVVQYISLFLLLLMCLRRGYGILLFLLKYRNVLVSFFFYFFFKKIIRTEGVKRKANVMGLGINRHMEAKSHNSTK